MKMVSRSQAFSRNQSNPCVDFNIELVVIRGIAMDSEWSETLYTWLSNVVQTACAERRDQRASLLGNLINGSFF